MNDRKQKNTSKFLSLVLRHQSEIIGVQLDKNGWISVSELLEACKKHGTMLTLDELTFIVETNNKKRFSFDEKQQRIRANQGHSVKVDLNLQPQTPPAYLYHGTAKRYLKVILEQGLTKKSRHHVHLSASIEVAREVGRRHGAPIVLEIDAAKMYRDGHPFYLSENGVWLTEHVPIHFLKTPKER